MSSRSRRRPSDRRRLPAVLAIVVSAVLPACGGGDRSAKEDTTATAAATLPPTTLAPTTAPPTTAPPTTVSSTTAPACGGAGEAALNHRAATFLGIARAGTGDATPALRSLVNLLEGSGYTTGRMTTGEALGLLRWRGQLDTALLKKAADEISGRCRADLIPAPFLSAFDALTPAKRADGTVALGDYTGRTCNADDGRYIREFDRYAQIIAMDCGKLLDLVNGLVIEPTTPPTADITFVAGRALRWTFTEVPATGLQPGGQKATLVSTAPDGSDQKALAELAVTPLTFGKIVGSLGRRVLSVESAGDEFVVARDAITGQELGRAPSGGSRHFELLPGVFETGKGTAFDLVTLTTIKASASLPVAPSRYACVSRARLRDTELIERGADGSLSVVPADLDRLAPVADGLVGLPFPTGDFRFVDAAGDVRWTIDEKIVSSWAVVAGHVWITNASGQLIDVDLATGGEAAPDQGLVALAKAASTEDAAVDLLAGTALIAAEPEVVRMVSAPRCATPSLAAAFAD